MTRSLAEFKEHRPSLARMLAQLIDDEYQRIESISDHFVGECMYRAAVLDFGGRSHAVCVKSSHPKAMGGITWWWEDEL